MSSNGKGKMPNVASFIKQNFNIVENSLVFFVLLGLEKLMDLEFNCPGDKIMAIVYSSVFLVVPAVIVGCVACYLSPQGKLCCKTEERENSSASDEEEVGENHTFDMEMSEETNKTKSTKCGCCCENITSHFFWIKAVVFWMLIVFTDGRYADCLVKSADQLVEIHKSNISNSELLLSWTEVRDNYLIHVFQIIGLLVFLVVIIMVVCHEFKIHYILSRYGVKFKSESERSKKMNEDILLQITEDTIQEQAKQMQKDFVVNLLSREDWSSYEPGRPNALEELEKITGKCKAEIKKQLEVHAPPKTRRDRV